jgi:hypothetical protein
LDGLDTGFIMAKFRFFLLLARLDKALSQPLLP